MDPQTLSNLAQPDNSMANGSEEPDALSGFESFVPAPAPRNFGEPPSTPPVDPAQVQVQSPPETVVPQLAPVIPQHQQTPELPVITAAELATAFKILSQQQGQQQAVPEAPQEELPWAPLPQDQLEAEIAKNLKAQFAYLDEEAVAEISKAQASLMAPILRQNADALNSTRSVEKRLEVIEAERQQAQTLQEKSQIREGLRGAYKDFDQVEPVMYQFWEQHKEELDKRFNYSQLPMQAQAQLLYGLVKTTVQINPAPPTQPQPTRQPQAFIRTNSLPPAPANINPTGAPSKPVDNLLTDIMASMK